MTQLRIRKKELPLHPRLSSVGPMGLILIAGALTSYLVQGGRELPGEVAWELAEQGRRLEEGLRLSYSRTQVFAVEEREWILADHGPVSFPASEVSLQGTVNGWTLVANHQRGLSTLGRHARPFDRLYLDLGFGRYAPLRWRIVP